MSRIGHTRDADAAVDSAGHSEFREADAHFVRNAGVDDFRPAIRERTELELSFADLIARTVRVTRAFRRARPVLASLTAATCGVRLALANARDARVAWPATRIVGTDAAPRPADSVRWAALVIRTLADTLIGVALRV